jgi:acyl-CoA thioester hydrolase
MTLSKAMNTPFQFPIRIYWEDTDAGGIVFYANYLKFFERARTEWLRALGIEQQALKTEVGGMFVVSETSLKYHRPAQLDDVLTVTAELAEAGRATLTLRQQAWRTISGGQTDPAPQLLAEGTIRIGWVDSSTLKPGRIPATILKALQS